MGEDSCDENFTAATNKTHAPALTGQGYGATYTLSGRTGSALVWHSEGHTIEALSVP